MDPEHDRDPGDDELFAELTQRWLDARAAGDHEAAEETRRLLDEWTEARAATAAAEAESYRAAGGPEEQRPETRVVFRDVPHETVPLARHAVGTDYMFDPRGKVLRIERRPDGGARLIDDDPEGRSA